MRPPVFLIGRYVLEDPKKYLQFVGPGVHEPLENSVKEFVDCGAQPQLQRLKKACSKWMSCLRRGRHPSFGEVKRLFDMGKLLRWSVLTGAHLWDAQWHCHWQCSALLATRCFVAFTFAAGRAPLVATHALQSFGPWIRSTCRSRCTRRAPPAIGAPALVLAAVQWQVPVLGGTPLPVVVPGSVPVPVAVQALV